MNNKCLLIIGLILSALSISGCSNNNYQNVDYLDEITFSKNRLKNADFSFNFSFREKKIQKIRKYESSSKAASNPYELTTDMFGLYEEENNLFDIYVNYLDSMRDQAINIVDNCINNITVLNKAVRKDFNDNDIDVLTYDGNNDIVHVYSKKEDHNFDIELYYDDYGREVVKMIDVSPNYGNIIEYIPNTYYYFNNIEFYNNILRTSVAYKGGDKLWNGFEYRANINNPIISKEGTYDFANNSIYISLMNEQKNHEIYITNLNTIIKRNDGTPVSSNQEAKNDDFAYLSKNFCSLNHLNYNYSGILEISPVVLNGIQKIVANNKTNDFNYFLNKNNGDYILLNNGIKIYPDDIYTKEYGICRFNNENGKFYDLDGNLILSSTVSNLFRFNEWFYFYGDARKIDSRITLTFREKDYSNNLDLFEDFMNKNNITFNNNVTNNFYDIARGYILSNINRLYLSYREVYNDALTFENFKKNFLNDHVKMFNAYKNIDDKINSYPSISYNELPKINNREPLINLNKVDNSVNFTNNSIDFNGISFGVKKSVLFREKSNYTIKASIGGGEYILDGFNTVNYERKDMSFSGLNCNITNDNLPKKEGKYLIKLSLSKLLDNSQACPLSNQVEVKVNKFDSFSASFKDKNNKTYTCEYNYDNGFINVSIKD